MKVKKVTKRVLLVPFSHVFVVFSSIYSFSSPVYVFEDNNEKEIKLLSVYFVYINLLLNLNNKKGGSDDIPLDRWERYVDDPQNPF